MSLLNRSYLNIFTQEEFVNILKNNRENILSILEHNHVHTLSKFLTDYSGASIYELPTNETITFLENTFKYWLKIINSTYVVEVCAGLGLFKRLFDEKNKQYSYIATNDFSNEQYLTFNSRSTFTEVKNLNVIQTLELYKQKNPIIICFWIPDEFELIKLCEKYNIKIIICIGNNKMMGNYDDLISNEYYNINEYDINTLSFKDKSNKRYSKVYIYVSKTL